jgi:hypothetical protein
MTLREQLIKEIEQAPEPVLREALRLIELLKDVDFNNPEAYDDALDLFEAQSVIAYSQARREEPKPWNQVQAELGMS